MAYKCVMCGTIVDYGNNCPVCLELVHIQPNATPDGIMSAKEFTDCGLLQEINRRILHPIGLALYVTEHDDGTVRLGGVFDMRHDPEGIIFDKVDADKIKCVDTMIERKRAARTMMFGWHIQEP